MLAFRGTDLRPISNPGEYILSIEDWFLVQFKLVFQFSYFCIFNSGVRQNVAKNEVTVSGWRILLIYKFLFHHFSRGRFFLFSNQPQRFVTKWSFDLLLNVEDSDGDDAIKHFSCQDHFFSRTTFVLRKSHHTDHGQFIKTIIMTIFKNKSVLKFIKSINWQKFGQYFLTYKIHPRYAS